MTPAERYQADLARPDFHHDPAQAEAVSAIQKLYDQLSMPDRKPGPLSRLFGAKDSPVRGLYLWGGVGRGKTYLMDCFYECLSGVTKRRVHFHHFMDDVHERLRDQAHHDDPLIQIAEQLSGEARVLCFDEFFVADIADAMILAVLFKELFRHQVVLVATSNIPPDQLYADGLQRAKFLPAIDAIKTHCRVLNVDGGVDHRLRLLEKASIYYSPLSNSVDRQLARRFEEICPGDWRENTVVDIHHRQIPVKRLGDGIVWVTFSNLCEGPRAASDYIELARRFNTVFLSDVPVLRDGMNDPARRFISLIDELYDRRVNVIISAQAPPQALYTGSKLAFEFDRTVSRLTEMQSHDYLAEPHRP